MGKHDALNLNTRLKLKETAQKLEKLRALDKKNQSRELSAYIEKEIMESLETLSETKIHVETLEKISSKLSKMKLGSIAELSQIKTISKMRILDPKKQNDVLYGIKLPSENLGQIDTRLIQMYTNKKLD